MAIPLTVCAVRYCNSVSSRALMAGPRRPRATLLPSGPIRMGKFHLKTQRAHLGREKTHRPELVLTAFLVRW